MNAKWFIMKHLSIIFLIALLIFSPSCKNDMKGGLRGKKPKTLEMLRAEQDSVRIADSLKRAENRLKEMEKIRQDSIRLVEKEKTTQGGHDKYNIIVGSYFTPDLAEACVEKYRKKGYNARIIMTANNVHELVVAESYEEASIAMERLKMFQDTVDADAWLYVKK